MTLDKILFVVGLVFDIIGAWFLARGIASKPLPWMADESRVGYGGPPNPRYLAGVLDQKADALVGFWLLALGFGIQALDYLSLVAPPLWSLPRWAVILGLPVLGLGVYRVGVLCRGRIRRRCGPRLLACTLRSVTDGSRRRERTDRYACELAEELIPWFARRPGEDDEAFARRIWAKIDAEHPES